MQKRESNTFRLMAVMMLLVFIGSCFALPENVSAKSGKQAEILNVIDYSEGLSFKLPVNNPQTDDWWNQTELNVTLIYDNPAKELTCGTWSLYIAVPDGYLPDGVYHIDCGLQDVKNDPNTYATSFVEIVIKNGTIDGENAGYHDGGVSYVPLGASYSYNNGRTKDTIRLLLKTHTECPVEGKEVFLTGVSFNDVKNGLISFPVSAADVICQKVSYFEGKYTDWKYGISAVGREIYCDNLPQVIYVGDKIKLKVGSDLYASQKLSFSSSNKKNLKVSSKGTVTAVKAGKATVTIKDKKNKVTFTREVTVKKPYLNVENTRKKIHVGTNIGFMAAAYGYRQGEITWKSSDTSVGSIDKATGKFSAKKVGKTTVTATDSAGYKCSFEIEVYDDGNRDVVEHITMHSNPEAGTELEELVYNHLLKVYRNVYEMFGDGNYHYIDVYFEHIDFAAAYATMGYSEDHNEIHIGIETLTSNINDLDCVTHELIHTAQNYPFSTKDGEDRTWLGEGLTDYGRYLLGVQNEKAGWRLEKYSEGQNYTDSYGTTAAFIKYVVDVHDPDFAIKLNEAFRKENYTEKLWKDRTGYTIDELWEMYKKW